MVLKLAVVEKVLFVGLVCLSEMTTIYLMQNFMAEAASAAQDHMGGSVSQGYSAYPTTAPVYAPPTSAGGGGHTGHAPSADYGPLYGTNYGY